jgi:hypothetical protein
MLRCQACSDAHNLTIAVRLASLDALPDSLILAASPGLATRRVKRDTGVFFWLLFSSRERKVTTKIKSALTDKISPGPPPKLGI